MVYHRFRTPKRIARFLTLAFAVALVIPPMILSRSATATSLAAEGWMADSAAATGWELSHIHIRRCRRAI